MTLKELARQDLLEAIDRMEREPPLQNWLAVDRLAEVFLSELEDEMKQKQCQAGFAKALPGEPIFTGGNTLEENYNDLEYSADVNADEVWEEDIDNEPPRELPTGEPPDEFDLMMGFDDEDLNEDDELHF